MVCTKTKLLFALHIVLCSSVTCTQSVNTLSANQTIKHGETIVSSPKETFELGFFSSRNSPSYYVGIWYKKISNRTVVWVANRNTPLIDNSSELTLTVHGVLVLRDAMNNEVWSSANSSTRSVRNPVGQLLDTGNFIIFDEADTKQENPIWQSFDYMTDTLLPGMKHGWNLVTGIERYFTSWKSSHDPAVGEFASRLDRKGYPQVIVTDGKGIKFRAGPWNGLGFTGVPVMNRSTQFFSYEFVVNQKEIYYQYNLLTDLGYYARLVLPPTGILEHLAWNPNTQEWSFHRELQNDLCDRYNVCGPFGSCDISNNPVCDCLKGFEPTSPEQWRVEDWSQGCRRTTPLNCGPGEGFKKYSNLKLPDTQWSWYNQSMNLQECDKMCKSNCSCTAYTNSNISGNGSGCLLWFGDLIDIRTFEENGDSLYIRLPPSEPENNKSSNAGTENNKSSNAGRRLRVIVPIASVVLVLLLFLCLFYRSKRKRQKQEGEDMELPLFSFSTIAKATVNFSPENKLGEGGFGVVYKGLLEEGQEIAVKRLSKSSSQGLDEFKNEVICISKLQHRNLVKLLGCCIRGDEKLLIYEYMPNRSLDSNIFDQTQSMFLDWTKRFNIIKGIARGVVYLHQDSRLRIIHRDLKASNILLDQDMNPKISDFGIARSFVGNETEANTERVVGIYGYMSPEYALDGIFSIKSDVFSFGVMVLEIVSGKKNRGFIQAEHENNLIGHAWSLYTEGRSMELVDESLAESCHPPEVLRSIEVGLLCVQQNASDRPDMPSVIMMLGGQVALLQPKQPAFFMERELPRAAFSSITCTTSSINDFTITEVDAR